MLMMMVRCLECVFHVQTFCFIFEMSLAIANVYLNLLEVFSLPYPPCSPPSCAVLSSFAIFLNFCAEISHIQKLHLINKQAVLALNY